MSAWSDIEVELIVADYFSMLSKELTGQTYNKSEHRRSLLPLLNGRTTGAVERKHQNISAALNRLGQPSIKGYVPLYNYQNVLNERVVDYLRENPWLETLFRNFAEKPLNHPLPTIQFENFLVAPPKSATLFEDLPLDYGRNPIKINYLEREQRNVALGLHGEELVLKYEKWNLITSGKEALADQVEWISQERGDGAGFDILSKNPNGTDKYIEVKTTKLGKETPFFFSRNELLFSQRQPNDFYLYRVFNFQDDVKLFTKNGPLDRICSSIPVSFRGII